MLSHRKHRARERNGRRNASDSTATTSDHSPARIYPSKTLLSATSKTRAKTSCSNRQKEEKADSHPSPPHPTAETLSHRKHRGRNKGGNDPASSTTNERLPSPFRARVNRTISSAQSRAQSKTHPHPPTPTQRSDCHLPTPTLQNVDLGCPKQRSKRNAVFSFTLTMPPDPSCDPPPDMLSRALYNVGDPLDEEMIEHVYELRHTERFCTQPAQIRRDMQDFDVYDRYLYGSDPQKVIQKWKKRPARKPPKLLPPTNPYWTPLPPKHYIHAPLRLPPPRQEKPSQNKDPSHPQQTKASKPSKVRSEKTARRRQTKQQTDCRPLQHFTSTRTKSPGDNRPLTPSQVDVVEKLYKHNSWLRARTPADVYDTFGITGFVSLPPRNWNPRKHIPLLCTTPMFIDSTNVLRRRAAQPSASGSVSKLPRRRKISPRQRRRLFERAQTVLQSTLPGLHQKKLSSVTFLMNRLILNKHLQRILPHHVLRGKLDITRSILSVRLTQRNSMQALYHVALSLLQKSSVQSETTSDTFSLRSRLSSNGIPSTQSRASTTQTIIQTDFSLKLNPSCLTQHPRRLPPDCACISSHLFLDHCPWLIPPWLARILSASPSWLVPPVPNVTVLLLCLTFLQQQPWMIPPWVCSFLR